MKIQVRLFAIAKQFAGQDAVELELPDGATIGELRQQLGRQVPSLKGLSAQVFFAVNEQYADDNTPIPPDAEIACIPPVSGG